jgi:hypothetical protein
MFYYTYKTTNLKTDKYYYGRHKSERLRNSYLGSGKIFKKALKKNGAFYFLKQILKIFLTYEEVVAEEIKLITKEVVDDPLCYNIALGGVGNPGSVGGKNVIWTEERRDKIRQQRLKEFEDPQKLIEMSILQKNAHERLGDEFFSKEGMESLKSHAVRRVEEGTFGVKCGQKFDKEWCLNISKGKKGVPQGPCPESKKKSISESNKNRVQLFLPDRNDKWINVKTDTVEEYLKNGYTLKKQPIVLISMRNPEGDSCRINLAKIEKYLSLGYTHPPTRRKIVCP